MRDTIYSVEVDGQVIEASSEHPFYVQGEWKETKNLDVGDKLTLFNQDCESSIDSITIEARRDTVYNLSVADFETYFVSQLGILVHNCKLTLGTKLNPKEVNFSQRTVSGNVEKYVADMKAGKWDWNKSGPIRVMEIDGKIVSYDNRRLMAAQQAGLKDIPYKVVKPTDVMPGSKKTWSQAFQKRFNDSRNVEAGGAVPNGGISAQPKIAK